MTSTAVTVWGVAAAHGSTRDAARGAFTWREYPDGRIPQEDWLQIITVVTMAEGDKP
jgi:hypothetical protein